MKKSPSKLAEEFYDKIFNLYHEEFNYDLIQYKEWLDLLISMMNKGNKILDLGCGSGRAVKYFIDREFKGVGIDLSDEMLKLARENVKNGEFYKKDFTQLDFGNNSFDAIISFFALNHIEKEKFKKIISDCKKILKKGGFLLLGMVRGSSEGYWVGFYGQKMELYGAGYTKKELSDILNSEGYKILKSGIEHFKGKYFEEDQIFLLGKK
ncbi:MAG: methyltransferase domain-containing protein [Candidatus Helarchaeota archaeon]|nr:methyltransferase domain-containing protein [Candidatus Helarchaeota archaeon]